MTQYFFLDESGDPGLSGGAGSSSHFVVVMIQLPNRAPLNSLGHVRQALGFPDTFEFKYHKTASAPKDLFFSEVLSIPLRVRAVVVDKKQLLLNWRHLSSQNFVIELIIQMTFRASELDIANELLIMMEQHQPSAGACEFNSLTAASSKSVSVLSSISSARTPGTRTAYSWRI